MKVKKCKPMTLTYGVETLLQKKTSRCSLKMSQTCLSDEHSAGNTRLELSRACKVPATQVSRNIVMWKIAGPAVKTSGNTRERRSWNCVTI